MNRISRLRLALTALVAATAASFAPSILAQQKATVALVTPLSGPLAGVGREVANGTRAWFDRMPGGRDVTLVVADDGNDPKKSAEAARSLIEKHRPVAFVNCFGTVGCMAQAEVLKGTGIPMIGPLAGAATLRDAERRHVFAIRPDAASEVRALVDYVKTIGFREVAIVYQDDGFGRAYLPIAQKVLPEQGVQVTTTVRIDPAAPDYPAGAKQLGGNGVTALLLLANVSHSVGILKAIADAGGKPVALNLASQANAGFINNMTGVWSYSVFAVFVPSPWKRGNDAAREYQQAWRATAKDAPFSYLGFEAYINARVLGEAIGRSRVAGPASVVAALEGLQQNFDDLTVKFAPGVRQGASFVDIAILSGRGTFVQ
jgi:ABC-type branched-subunit amino acid transport system substrate-binding protein